MDDVVYFLWWDNGESDPERYVRQNVGVFSSAYAASEYVRLVYGKNHPKKEISPELNVCSPEIKKTWRWTLHNGTPRNLYLEIMPVYGKSFVESIRRLNGMFDSEESIIDE